MNATHKIELLQIQGLIDGGYNFSFAPHSQLHLKTYCYPDMSTWLELSKEGGAHTKHPCSKLN